MICPSRDSGFVYDPAAADPPTDLMSCSSKIADAIMSKKESFLKVMHVDIGQLNLGQSCATSEPNVPFFFFFFCGNCSFVGALLLELLLFNPIFAGKKCEEIKQLCELGEEVKPYVEVCWLLPQWS